MYRCSFHRRGKVKRKQRGNESGGKYRTILFQSRVVTRERHKRRQFRKPHPANPYPTILTSPPFTPVRKSHHSGRGRAGP